MIERREPRTYGYTRVSRGTQRDDRQLIELESQCDEVVTETIKADSESRPKFDRLLQSLRRGDTLIVFDLDRAFRNMVDAILTLHDLRERGVHFKILNSSLDLTTTSGRLLYVIKAHFAEEELATIRRRTREGLAAARARGVKLGRPRVLTDEQIMQAHRLVIAKRLPLYQIAKRLGVSSSTVSNGFKRLELSS